MSFRPFAPPFHAAKAAVLLVLAACSGTDDPSAPVDDPPDPGADWVVSMSGAPTDLEPGAEVTLDFDIAGSDPSTAILWIDPGEEDEYGGAPLLHPVRSGTVWDSRSRTQIHLPVLTPGVHTLALGDTLAPRSNEITVEVVEPERMRSQAEVALTIELALSALGDGVADLLRTRDANGAPLFEPLGPEALDGTVSLMEGVGDAGGVIADQYRALSTEEELRLQAMFRNTGILDVFDGLAALTVAGAPERHGARVPADPADVRHIPHTALYTADVLEAMLAALGPVMDVATIATVVGTAGTATGISLGTSIVVNTVRATINTVIPTDVVSLSTHAPEGAEVGVPATSGTVGRPYTAHYWARMRPKETVLAGIGQGYANVVLNSVGALRLAPKKVKQALAGIVEDVILNLAASLGRIPALTAADGGGYVWTVDVVANPRLYTFTLMDVIDNATLLNPLLAPLVGPFEAGMKLLVAWDVVEDPEIAGSVTIAWDAGTPPGTPVFTKSWDEDAYAVDGVAATPAGSWDATVTALAWHMGSFDPAAFIADWLDLYSIPVPVLSDPVSYPLTVANDDARPPRAILYATPDATSPDAPVDWLWEGDLDAYPPRFRIRIEDRLGQACPSHSTEVSATLNGTLWLSGVVLGGGVVGPFPSPMAKPGRNELVVTATGSFICRIVTPQLGADIDIGFEGAGNIGFRSVVRVSTREYLPTDADPAPTAVDTIVVWMPPAPPED